jgi:hypothetical protein
MATIYPGRLRQLMTLFRRQLTSACPEARVRLTYAPFENMDVLVEVYMDEQPPVSTMTLIGEMIGEILADGYTVRAVVKDGRWQPPVLTDIDLMLAVNG